MELKLQQKESLQLKLTPTQILVEKLLEVPSCELSQRVNEELQSNPALEEGLDPSEENEDRFEQNEGEEDSEEEDPLQNEDFDYTPYVEDDETPDYKARTSNYTAEEDTKEIPISVGTSFIEYLKSQIYYTKMDKPDRHIAKFIVGNIDENGYLLLSAEQLSDELAFKEGLNVSVERIETIIREIQTFDPVGVGAKDIQECLLIQLRQLSQNDARIVAEEIIEKYFDDFRNNREEKLCQRLNLSHEQLKAVKQEILRLNPKPGSQWSGTVYDRNQTTIVPDFQVEEKNGLLVVSLAYDKEPELHVSNWYKTELNKYNQTGQLNEKQKKEASFFKEKITAAQGFINAIKQRKETLLTTMEAIVRSQEAFFRDGENTSLKPLREQDIAQMTGLDNSTISRVVRSKHVSTIWGTFPLRHFFSEKMMNTNDEEISTREVKQILLEIIQNEDKSNPMTDEQLVDAMKAQGYTIARRTIVKYRQQNNIPVARLRRSI